MASSHPELPAGICDAQTSPPCMKYELIPAPVNVAALFWAFPYILINVIKKNLLIFQAGF